MLEIALLGRLIMTKNTVDAEEVLLLHLFLMLLMYTRWRHISFEDCIRDREHAFFEIQLAPNVSLDFEALRYAMYMAQMHGQDGQGFLHFLDNAANLLSCLESATHIEVLQVGVLANEIAEFEEWIFLIKCIEGNAERFHLVVAP